MNIKDIEKLASTIILITSTIKKLNDAYNDIHRDENDFVWQEPKNPPRGFSDNYIDFK